MFGWWGLHPPGFSLFYCIFTLQTNPLLLLLWQIKNCLSVTLPVCFLTSRGEFSTPISRLVKRNFWFRFSAVLLISLQCVWKPMPKFVRRHEAQTHSELGLALAYNFPVQVSFHFSSAFTRVCISCFSMKRSIERRRERFWPPVVTQTTARLLKIKVKYKMNILWNKFNRFIVSNQNFMRDRSSKHIFM